jgi:thymidylate kinase
MTSPRQALLATFFRILEDKAVPYCVLRNYANIYEDTSSDVDLVVEEPYVETMRQCLAEAAARTEHHFVLFARYVNFSYVYWHPDGGFIRLDLETEVRWRVFPILTAKAICTLRRKHGDFYIPHPRHEAAILFSAAIWRGFLSERYRQQLARLYTQVSGPEELQRTYRAAYGTIGPRLTACHARVQQELPGPGLWQAARRSLLWHAFHDAPTRREFCHFLATDLRRLWQRLRQPPGISVLYASNAHPARNLEDFFHRINFLFPVQKAARHDFRVAPQPGERIVRLGVRLRLHRLYALFKGGLFIRFYDLQQDQDLRRAIQTHTRYLYPTRTFIWSEDSRCHTCLGHVHTGFMADLSPPGAPASLPAGAQSPERRQDASAPGEAGGGGVANDSIIRFLAHVLEHYRQPEQSDRAQRGAFVVLLGLDGSGKTTVARQVCCLGPGQSRFRRIRYFHWQPRLFRSAEFPLPEARNLPRKPEQRPSLLGTVFSTARLLKNLLLTRLAHTLRVGPLLRGGSLVLVDRYFYNYFLDPVSVKYVGPAWLLNWARRLFPRPDLVVVLKAPPETLLARKQELSREEIQQQIARLDQLKCRARETLELDASRPAPELAQAIWDKAVELADRLIPPPTK